MKKVFYLGLLGLVLFEFLKLYFIMPLPGSQRIDSLDFAYFLHRQRWLFRAFFLVLIAAGASSAFRATRKLRPLATSTAAFAIIGYLNFQMSAESMFRPPTKLVFKSKADNQVPADAAVIGVERNGEAKAYPIRFLVYHHQVEDTVGGVPLLVTYCSVCRTGRVFERTVQGRLEKFRLVGMDHFNALFEDSATKSWWRQATGDAVTGPLKGTSLPEIEATQSSVSKWFDLHPRASVMQLDEASREQCDAEGKFERGENKGKLTKTDRASWAEKSWVVGVEVGSATKAYDWNQLKEKRVINDIVNGRPIVLALAADQQSFAAFERPAEHGEFSLDGDLLSADGKTYDFAGRDLTNPNQRLVRVNATQEFWHSWRTFHPETTR